MPKPIAVLISDVHYSLPTLQLADAAMRMAIDKANNLKVPLIVCGDLHDTKANLRGECMNAMINTFQQCKIPPYVLRGNHDSINEKSTEHSLGFLEAVHYGSKDYDCPEEYPELIVKTGEYNTFIHDLNLHFIPYEHDVNELRAYLKAMPKGSTLIMHQGIEGSNSGDYIQDKSAINPQDVAGMRVISGHYHTRQTIKLPGDGIWDYVGNPFTLNYAEANDPPKGYQILMSDGSLEFMPTNLRKHVVFEGTMSSLEYDMPGLGLTDDLAWVKIKDKRENLILGKAEVAKRLKFQIPFRLDLIPTDSKTQADMRLNLSQGPLLDYLIDSLTNTSDEQKTRLKQTWKDLCE